jgi:hypothetical protein
MRHMSDLYRCHFSQTARDFQEFWPLKLICYFVVHVNVMKNMRVFVDINDERKLIGKITDKSNWANIFMLRLSDI